MKALVMCIAGLMGAASLSAQSTQTTQTCRFNNGPLSGQTKNLPFSNPTRVGYYCSDGLSSSGVAIADRARVTPPVDPRARASGSPTGDSGVMCRMTSGPLAGQTTSIPNDRLPILGSTCYSGRSRGVVVPILE